MRFTVVSLASIGLLFGNVGAATSEAIGLLQASVQSDGNFKTLEAAKAWSKQPGAPADATKDEVEALIPLPHNFQPSEQWTAVLPTGTKLVLSPPSASLSQGGGGTDSIGVLEQLKMMASGVTLTGYKQTVLRLPVDAMLILPATAAAPATTAAPAAPATTAAPAAPATTAAPAPTAAPVVAVCDQVTTVDPPANMRIFSSKAKDICNGVFASTGPITAWIPKKKEDQWIQLDLGSMQLLKGVVVRGREDDNQWVTSFSVMTSDDGNTWAGMGETFAGNHNNNENKEVAFSNPVQARFVRIYPQSWEWHPSMHVALLTCAAEVSS